MYLTNREIHIKMKTIFKLVIAAMLILGFTSSATAQEESLGSQVTKKVGMYVFPAKGQTQDQIADRFDEHNGCDHPVFAQRDCHTRQDMRRSIAGPGQGIDPHDLQGQ